MRQIKLCGVKIDDLTQTEAVERALERTGETSLVFTPNALMLEQCARAPRLASLLSHASLSLPDGAGVLLAAKRAGTPLTARVAGIDFGYALLAMAEKRGLRVFFLGGKEGVAKRAATRLQADLPSLTVAGTHDGYFDRSGEENRLLLSHVRQTRTDVLLVCMGFPLQEEWVVENRAALADVCVVACLGGSLDVWSGEKRRAPRLLSRMGMEWAWRMACEPRRMKDAHLLARFALRSLGGARFLGEKKTNPH